MSIRSDCIVLQFDQDYLEFRNQVDNLRNAIQSFMDSWFQRSLSVSAKHQTLVHVQALSVIYIFMG